LRRAPTTAFKKICPEGTKITKFKSFLLSPLRFFAAKRIYSWEEAGKNFGSSLDEESPEKKAQPHACGAQRVRAGPSLFPKGLRYGIVFAANISIRR
jgi:hypothetical protein